MRVRRFAPWLKGVCLDGELILGRDDVPRLELLGHSLYGLIFVTHVVLFQISMYFASTAVTMALTTTSYTTSCKVYS